MIPRGHRCPPYKNDAPKNKSGQRPDLDATPGEPGCALLYAENDEPQPQVLVAFGFLMTNWAPSRSSL